MTYSEFVKIYPALDLFLELFKGLGPTLIAILAIVLNHRNSVKRDKENRRNSLYYTVQKEKSPLYSTFCSQWLPASYSSHSPAGFSFANYKAMQEQDAFLILFIISIYLLIYFWR